MALAFAVTLLAGLSTCLGGWLGTHHTLRRRDVLAAALAAAGGLMIAISVLEIVPGAVVDMVPLVGHRAALLWTIGMVVLGALAVLGVSRTLPSRVDPGQVAGAEGAADVRLLRSGMVVAVVISLHNLPEGLITFVSVLQEPVLGLAIAGAIALHNIPEGVAVAAPVYAATGSRRRALVWATVAGLAEPVGAVIGYLLIVALLPAGYVVLALALVAGMMLAVAVTELLPTAMRYATHPLQPVLGGAVGAAVMIGSLVLLGVVAG